MSCCKSFASRKWLHSGQRGKSLPEYLEKRCVFDAIRTKPSFRDKSSSRKKARSYISIPKGSHSKLCLCDVVTEIGLILIKNLTDVVTEIDLILIKNLTDVVIEIGLILIKDLTDVVTEIGLILIQNLTDVVTEIGLILIKNLTDVVTEIGLILIKNLTDSHRDWFNTY